MSDIYSALIFFAIIHCFPDYTLHSVYTQKVCNLFPQQFLASCFTAFAELGLCRISIWTIFSFLTDVACHLEARCLSQTYELTHGLWGRYIFFWYVSNHLRLQTSSCASLFSVLSAMLCSLSDCWCGKISNVIRWKSPTILIEYRFRAKTAHTTKEITQQFLF